MMFEKIAPDSHIQGDNKKDIQAPRSPEGPPPGSSSMFAPRSPEGLPPEGGVDEEDASLVRILKIREIAIRMAGGEDLWDELDEDDVDIFKERAELELDSYS